LDGYPVAVAATGRIDGLMVRRISFGPEVGQHVVAAAPVALCAKSRKIDGAREAVQLVF